MCFNTWAREEPNLVLCNSISLPLSFNTWAREEPNKMIYASVCSGVVSILGLARSPTRTRGHGLTGMTFQYLGSRGAQLDDPPMLTRMLGFNTWAREEPNVANVPATSMELSFQYLGSRGAQLMAYCFNNNARSFNTWAREEPNNSSAGSVRSPPCFNTWAREEPNALNTVLQTLEQVSILGLARSPTHRRHAHQPSAHRFNTWAREEPNL